MPRAFVTEIYGAFILLSRAESPIIPCNYTRTHGPRFDSKQLTISISIKTIVYYCYFEFVSFSVHRPEDLYECTYIGFSKTSLFCYLYETLMAFEKETVLFTHKLLLKNVLIEY